MDHTYSVKTHAVDRYLLNELKGGQREEFEEHFFDCPTCADEVRTGMLLMDNASALLSAEPIARPARSKPSWFAAVWPRPAFMVPTFALLIVSGFLFHDHQLVSGLRNELAAASQPQAVADVTFDSARGNEPVTVAREERYMVASFNLSKDVTDSAYLIEISGAGVAPATVRSAPPALGSPFHILLPTARYKPGSYEFIIKSATSQAEIQRIGLTLK